MVVKKPSPEELELFSPVPEQRCGIETFAMSYEQTELCYILSGRACAELDGTRVYFGEGDLVEFPRGTRCVWSVSLPVVKKSRRLSTGEAG